ncbi:GDSL esterase/lipase [Panicum miliaceum]|uniref:GDSL esterase/lipase n=1 Tax=Panicum miliaceum TaxID=4540 RepID=A0A3L6SZ97_PANMI|nr:GDSL esterase/lipase [Panicum miliaceum]
MASAMNGGGGGGALKRIGPLRLQYYIVMGAVAAAVVLATLRYMPGPAAAAATTSSVVRPGASAAAPGAEAVAEAEEEKRKKKGDGVVLFNFGDSNSDTGGVAAVMGIRIAPPEGRAYFHHPTGRLSDGRVILDFICKAAKHPSPSITAPCPVGRGPDAAAASRATAGLRWQASPAAGDNGSSESGGLDGQMTSSVSQASPFTTLDGQKEKLVGFGAKQCRSGESLGMHHLSPFMKPLGSNFTNGVNFAIAGSTAMPGVTTFSLDVQVDQFIFFKERCLDAIERGESAPVDEMGFQTALYTMDIGHNDINGVLHMPYDEMIANLPPVITEIKKAIERLHKNGARKFWIHGTGALGCMPQKLAMPRDDDSGLNEHGCIASINNVCKKFNSLLSEALDELRLTLKKSAIVFVDMFAIKYDLVANHKKYGIEKPLMTCCGHGGPPYNYDPKKSCMTSDEDLCKLGEKFISWDGVHFTDAANGIVASKVLSGEYSIPRVKLASLVSTAKSDD